MPVRTLRRHLEEADRIMSIGGVKTLLPTKERRAPAKVAVSNAQMIYAMSIRRVVERFDRTGRAAIYLRASDETACEVWRSIPQHAVCPLCLRRVPEERIGKGRVFCKRCGKNVWPRSYQGLVSADIRSMRKALRNGTIPCRSEKGERG